MLNLVLAVIVLVGSTQLCIADDTKSADEILADTTKQLEALKSWSADFETSGTAPKGHNKTSGHMVFNGPNLLRVEMNNTPVNGDPSAILLVMGNDLIMWRELSIGSANLTKKTKGKVHSFKFTGAWKSITKINMATVMNNAQAKTSDYSCDPPKELISGRQWELTKDYMKWKTLRDSNIEGQPVWILEGTWIEEIPYIRFAQSQKAAFGNSRLYVGKQDGFVHRVVQFNKSNKAIRRTTEIKNIVTDADTTAVIFNYKPSYDMQQIVEDKTAAFIAGEKGFWEKIMQ